ncbi:class I SAM-dependent methyltransferase [Silvibacterium dinghuense]|uniref:Class I SAM-dependent methyltransferase n=1 Tax=Silvibacterium dinghuense TaxID=1560006 RepID=A0A4Q1S9Y7_9BACT|nr:class I SAM-dependent methyltransferase [Silvibacterium dinghuense]RXS93870.1 class I SAM-dependent methyltransferase [Silvibacterium dinghuense]GGH08358.1 methyltransferase [Silvibacterium dinghuense]
MKERKAAAHEVAAAWETNADAWSRHTRSGYDVYRDALHTPAFLAALPPVAGLQGLDIGCGEGANTRALARLGARMQGVDIAPTFVRYAEEAERAEPLGIQYRQGDGMALPFADRSFDFATAFMSLMDMPEPGRALAEARRVLRPGGFLQCTILHPCFVPPSRRVLRDEQGQAFAVQVADYFRNPDGEVERWWFSTLPAELRQKDAAFQTPVFHHTLGAWVEMVVSAGLVLEAMIEPSASEEVAAQHPVVADTRIVPLALIIRARCRA